MLEIQDRVDRRHSGAKTWSGEWPCCRGVFLAQNSQRGVITQKDLVPVPPHNLEACAFEKSPTRFLNDNACLTWITTIPILIHQREAFNPVLLVVVVVVGGRRLRKC